MSTSITSIDSAITKKLEQQIFQLAEITQDEMTSDSDIYRFIENLMSNRLFTREFFVATLEHYNDTLEGIGTGLESATRFSLIDAFDAIVRIKGQQKITRELTNKVI